MKKSIPVKPKRGRPATGKDPFVGVRLPPQLIDEITKWSGQHEVASRSEAIRRLVELGLLATVNSPDMRYQAKASDSATKAKKLAGELGLKAKK
jgi:Arc/MetJ-type ribon-helix-helix transcriptional regulator